MRNLARASAILGALIGGSGALALAAAGCGGDDNIVNPDAHSDGTTDVKSDHTTDVKVDHRKVDGGTDTGTDTGTDGAVDADAVSDAPADVRPDNAALYAFPHEVSVAWCMRLANCCGDDGGTFDIKTCANLIDVGGGAIANVGTAVVDSGNIVFMPSEAKKCLDDTAAITCGTLNATTFSVLRTECAAAMQGRLGPDAGPCQSSFDCLPGNHCPSVGGKCYPLRTLGQPCVDSTFSTDCSYLGNGSPTLYCDPDSGTCKNQLANGTTCVSGEQCQSLICDYFATVPDCSNTILFSDKGTPGGLCTDYPLDAGGGG